MDKGTVSQYKQSPVNKSILILHGVSLKPAVYMVIHNPPVSASCHGGHVKGAVQPCIFVHIGVIFCIKSPLPSHFHIAVLIVSHMNDSGTRCKIIPYRFKQLSLSLASAVFTGYIQPGNSGITVFLQQFPQKFSGKIHVRNHNDFLSHGLQTAKYLQHKRIPVAEFHLQPALCLHPFPGGYPGLPFHMVPDMG